MKRKTTRREFLAETGATAAALALAGSSVRGASAKPQEQAYLAAARTFLDTLVDKGTDRYGKKHTPVFCLSLDPETYTPPKPPEKIDWAYRREFEYLYVDYGFYWKSHMHGSDLIYDQGTIRALYALTEATGKPKYKKAADAYLDFFLDELVSPPTGIFGWGEHIFYNVFADVIIGGSFGTANWHRFFYGHEFDRFAPIYDILWDKSPEKTLAEIDAIYDYKIVDKDTFINNRHSDYYIGRTLDVFTFHKHTVLFAQAFALAYSKTHDKKYLDWARKCCDVFWNVRNPKTDVVGYCIQRPEDVTGGIEPSSVLAYMRAYQTHPDPMFLERGLAYMRAYQNHVAQPTGGRPIWAKVAALAYTFSGDDTLLKTAENIIMNVTPESQHGGEIERSCISADVEQLGDGVCASLDLYEVTADPKYLAKAREFADDAIKSFLYKGLFVGEMHFNLDNDEGPRVKIYDARGGAGWLALDLIRLQRHVDATKAGKFKKRTSLDRIYG